MTITESEIQFLKERVGKVVRLNCTDGEVIMAKIVYVDTEDLELVYEMLSTTDQSKYEKYDEQPAYLIHFPEISSVEPPEGNE
jgi:hypothetical protein